MLTYFSTELCTVLELNHMIKYDIGYVIQKVIEKGKNINYKYYYDNDVTKFINACLKLNKTRFRECHIKSFVNANIPKYAKYIQVQPYVPKSVKSINIEL